MTEPPIDVPKFLRLAYHAATASPDPSTQNGALILTADGVCTPAACNTFPRGVKSSPARLERPLKYSVIEHAERNAIYAAARLGIPTDGATLVCQWFACDSCARAIIQAGIRRVIGHKPMFDLTPPHWKESIAIAFEMMEEAGVETELYPDALGGCEPIRFNGALWTP